MERIRTTIPFRELNPSLQVPILSAAKYGIPLLSSITLNIVCLIPVLSTPTSLMVGFLLSGPIYQCYIVLSLGLLVLPGTGLLPSVFNRVKAKDWFWWSLDIIACTLLLSHGLKFLLHLPRPSGSPSGSVSGHTAFAFGLAWLILETYPRLAPLWFGLAVAIGWSRIETQAHYAYQVPLGAALGATLGWLVSRGWSEGVIVPRCVRHLRIPVLKQRRAEP
jgi:membrane-associated phospholipid phosphatase